MHQEGDFQRAISEKLGIFQHGLQSLVKTSKKTGQVERKSKSGRLRNLSPTDEQYLKAMS